MARDHAPAELSGVTMGLTTTLIMGFGGMILQPLISSVGTLAGTVGAGRRGAAHDHRRATGRAGVAGGHRSQRCAPERGIALTGVS